MALAFESVTETLSGGAVDWTRLELVASAVGEPPGGSLLSWEAMEGEARSRLGPRILELSRLVRMDSQRTAKAWLDGANRVADRLDDNLSMWEAFQVRYFTSGRVEMEGSLPLHAWLRPALVDLAEGKERESPPTGPITGLLLDARGLELLPAVCPSIRSLGGQELYNAQTVTPAAIAQRAPVIYVSDPANPLAVARLGESPLQLRAVSIHEEVDLVVSDTDAARLRERAAEAPFLLHGNVVVVVDPR